MASISRSLSGRKVERSVLERLAASEKSEFLALYGRRRVGKTFLVRRFFQDKTVIYFEVVGRFGGTLDDHLRIFSESLARTFHEGAALKPPDDWHEAFRMLVSAIESRRTKRKFVLFFDEVPWMATHRSGFLQELEHFWNAWVSQRDDVILVVCGSAASWMLRKIVNAKGGLHDRLTQTIRLLPFTLSEVRDFFAHRRLSLTTSDLVELYMVFGGVPHYLDHVERGLSVAQIVDRACLQKDAPLVNEFDRLFTSLFGDDETYVAVVRALSKQRRGLTRNELLRALGVGSGGGSTQILENLEEAGFISSAIPFGRTSRDRFFRLSDQFSAFHLKWLATRRPSSWQHERRSPRWQAWAGLTFESVCHAHAAAIQRALGISGVKASVSAWSHPEAQIDMLIDRADDVVSLVEIKFTDTPFEITRVYADQLRRKVAVFRAQTKLKKAVHLVMMTSHGVAPNRYAKELVDAQVTMEDLFV